MRPFGAEFCLTLLTDDPALAALADRESVNRVGLDLEQLGKQARQSAHVSRLSLHKAEQLAVIGPQLQKADLFVRINPLNANSAQEIEDVLRFGARVLMLPYFRQAAEVERFVRLVDQRARVVVLVETAAAVVRIREIVAVRGIDEVMFGLNDLHLAFGVQNHFEVLTSPLMDALADEVRKADLPFSVGGVARPDDASLPVSPDLVLAQYPRLGATGAWLSRSFVRNLRSGADFAEGLSSIRRRLSEWASAPQKSLAQARDELGRRAHEMASDVNRRP